MIRSTFHTVHTDRDINLWGLYIAVYRMSSHVMKLILTSLIFIFVSSRIRHLIACTGRKCLVTVSPRLSSCTTSGRFDPTCLHSFHVHKFLTYSCMQQINFSTLSMTLIFNVFYCILSKVLSAIFTYSNFL